jgi:hypothetical protein
MATPVFTCGFECRPFAAGVMPHWDTGSAVETSTTTVRSGARALRIQITANQKDVTGLVGTSGTTKVWRVYIRFATLPDADTLLAYYDYGGTNAGVGFRVSDSTLCAGTAVSGVESFGTNGVAVTTGVWYRADIKSVGSVVTGTVDVQVDGSACTQATAAFVSANSTFPKFGTSGSNVTMDAFYDDVLLSETAGDYPLGAGFVNHFVPTADGTHNVAGAADFDRTDGTDITNATTTAWQLVDDVPLESIAGAPTDYISMTAPPNTTDYVELVFGPASGISTPTAGPRAVEVIADIAQAGTGTGNVLLSLNDNGTLGTIYTATAVAGTVNGKYVRAHFADPPSAASVWNAANDGGNGDFRDLRARLGSPAAGVDANPDQYLVSIMIEAEFSDAGTTVTVTAVAATTSSVAVPLPTITAQAIELVTTVPAEAPASVPIPTVTQGRLVVPGAVEATAAVPLPTITAVHSVTIGVPAVTADAAVPLPTVTAQVIIAVTAIAAEATAAVPLPAVQKATTVAVPAVAADAAVPLPTVTAQAVVSITAVAAEASASVPIPTVTQGRLVTVPAITADAEVPLPTVSSVDIVSVAVPVVTADAAVPLPTVTAQDTVLIAVPAVAAEAAVPIPTVTTAAAGGITVIVPTITADAAVPLPTVTSQDTVTVVTVPAETPASVSLPTVTAQVIIAVVVPAISADAAVPLPTVTAQDSVSITALPAEASGEVPLPTLTAQDAVTVSAVPTESTAAVLIATVTGGSVSVTVIVVPAEATAAVGVPNFLFLRGVVLAGLYAPNISLTGVYAPDVSLAGQYSPNITLAGRS